MVYTRPDGDSADDAHYPFGNKAVAVGLAIADDSTVNKWCVDTAGGLQSQFGAMV